MRLIDIVFVGVVAGLALWRALAPRRGAGRLRLAAGAAAGLGVAHLLLAGFTWQAVPGWGLIAAVGLEAWFKTPPALWIRCGLAFLGLAALAPWAVLPQLAIPAPDGRFAVGTQIYRWTDPSRRELATADPRDRRSVIVQAWYPATGGGFAPPAYMDGLGRLPPTFLGAPRFVFHHWDRTDTHALGSPATAPSVGGWPVIVFSPGYGAPRAAYTGLALRLAARGYVVLAVDHPFEGPLVLLPDGRLALGQPLPGRTNAQIEASMDRQVQVRAADIRFVIDQLSRPGVLSPQLAGRLDLARLYAAGHSFGGAAAVLAARADPRIEAVVNVDGTLYSRAWEGRFHPRLLILQSGPRTGHGDNYRTRAAALLAAAGPSAQRIVLARANHYSFTDLEFTLAEPARWALRTQMGGEAGAAAAQRETAYQMDRFLRSAWGRMPDDP